MKKTRLGIIASAGLWLAVSLASSPVGAYETYYDKAMPRLYAPATVEVSDSLLEEKTGQAVCREEDYETTELADGTLAILSYTGEDTCIALPSEINGRKVTSIEKEAFFNHTYLEYVFIPDSITKVGEGAFMNCVSLVYINIPDSVTKLGRNAFARTVKLSRINLGKGITEIPELCFYLCSSLKSLELSDQVTKIGKSAFANCFALADITIPDSVQSIGAFAFHKCIGLDSLYLPVETLEDKALDGVSLSSLSFSENLKTLGDNALYNLTVKELELPASLTDIEESAFSGFSCDRITVASENPAFSSQDGVLYTKDLDTLVKYPSNREADSFSFPDSVTSIAAYAFENTASLTAMTIPDQISDIGRAAFKKSGLTSVTIPAAVETLPEEIFYACDSLTSVTLSEGVKVIKDSAFEKALSLEELALPDSLEKISPLACKGCSAFTSYLVSENNGHFSAIDGVLYNKGQDTLVSYPAGRKAEDEAYLITSGTQEIAEYAFAYNHALENVILADTVDRVGDKAFFGCTALDSITVDEALTEIGYEAFGYTDPSSTEQDPLTGDFYLIGEEDGAAADYAAENGLAMFTEQPDLSPDPIDLKTGESLDLYQTGVLPGTAYFTSSDETIADVSADGLLEAISEGTATIYISAGFVNIKQTVNITGESVDPDRVPDYILIGSEYDFNPEDYEIIELEDAEAFQDSYMAFNSDQSFDPLDNACIQSYSSNEYTLYKANQGVSRAIRAVKGTYVEDYDFFECMAEGLSEELSNYKFEENLILYRGISSFDDITQGGETMADMKAAIGKTIVIPEAISTSLVHKTAYDFTTYSRNTSNAVLEIYAPADRIRGAYIEMLSLFDSQYELLLDAQCEFLVLDAGVHEMTEDVDEDGTQESYPERYFKLLLL